MPEPPPTAVLFQTHFFDRWAAAAFRRLRAGAPAHMRCTVLIHLPPGAPVPPRLAEVPHHVVRTPALRDPIYPAKSADGPQGWSLWFGGHTDLILLDFCRTNPGFARYWVVEYDVRFSGDWRRFFAAFEEDEADLLAPCVVRRRDDPGWYNWPSLHAPEAVNEDCALRAFLPIFRASRHLVEAMDAAYRAGWGGHCEATWPTIARARGLVVADLGGEGEFTAPRNRGRFYASTPTAEFLAPGTLLFKPALYRAGTRRDVLWHPVKPFWWRVELREGLRDMRAAVGRVLRAWLPWALPRRWRVPGAFTGQAAPPTPGDPGPAEALPPAAPVTVVRHSSPQGATQ